MKKQLLLLFAFSLLLLNGFAQKRFNVGVKAGVSTSQVEGDSYSGFNKAGLDGGIYVVGKFNDKWTAQMEMIFIQKGSKHNSNPDKNDYTYYYMGLNYVEVPLMVQYHQKKFGFEAGPVFGYLISSKDAAPTAGPTISLTEVAKIPLVLPGHSNARRVVIDRTFAKAGLSLNVAAEASNVPSELSAVRSGAGSTILNLGEVSGFGDFAAPVLIEPTFYLTCCIIWSNEFPLTLAAEGVKKLLIEFVRAHVETTKRPGAVWLD